MASQTDDLYEPTGVLKRGVHERLTADLPYILERAGLGPANAHLVGRTLVGHVSERELGYVRDFNQWPAAMKFGLWYDGGVGPFDARARMMAICAGLIRNFVDARVLTFSQLVNESKDGNPPKCTALLVPNLYDREEKVPSWQVQIVGDVLGARMNEGVHTCVYVSSIAGVEEGMGRAVAEMIQRGLVHVTKGGKS